MRVITIPENFEMSYPSEMVMATGEQTLLEIRILDRDSGVCVSMDPKTAKTIAEHILDACDKEGV